MDELHSVVNGREARGASGTLRLVALGGLGEIGMNCLALEQDGAVVLIDCGVTFPAIDQGVDIYHPRFDHVLERAGALRGVIVTHGHEDHIGALPYLLARAPVPVWAPAHAMALARQRIEEHGLDPSAFELCTTSVRRTYDAGPFSFEPVRVTHSIAEATALAIRTSAGLVVHTGDFKLDADPPDGERTDEARLRELGDEGVRLLLSDSTSVDAAGTSGGERSVGDALGEIVAAARTRVVVGFFASNVQRLRMLGEIAARTGRRLCLLGRSTHTHVRAAKAVGMLPWPSDLLVPAELVGSLPRDRVLVLASGTQGERASALSRLANGTHPAVRLEQDDVVVLSSRIIPGNDRAVYDVMAAFLRLGVVLTTRMTDRRVHTSGHAHRDEQRRMIQMTRPRAFVPVHGTLHHLVRHAELAREEGVPDALVVENGDLVEVGAGGLLAKRGRVPVGRVAAFGGEPVGDDVLRERAMLGRSGAVFVAVVVDRHGRLSAPPRVVARGVAGAFAAGSDMVLDAARAVARAVDEVASGGARPSDDDLGEAARLAARRAMEARTGQRPVAFAAVTRLGGPRR